MPIYFVSRALQGPELNYTLMEKLVISLVFAAKRTIAKMKRYAGRTQYHIPAKDVCKRTDPTGFPYGSDACLILTSPEGTEFTYSLRFQFTASNNEAKYKALIAGLRIAAQIGVRNVHPLTPITAPWPFYKWGIDIAGPFPKGPRKVKFWIVAMDYFTKWIEAKVVSTITGNQFSDNPFKDWCEKLNITQRFALVKHPQSNGLVEIANRSLGDGIKARPVEGNKNWIEEIPHVLWAHRMTIKSSHGDTLFSLTYGTEAVIPVEIRMPTYRTAAVDVHNDEELQLNLDLLEEKRERAAIREAKAKYK
ncbi:reverse transcriptase domain-containing protein [Tanacetum coccineum]